MRNSFSFKKHQREVAKKKKKEEKLQLKLEKKLAKAAGAATPAGETENLDAGTQTGIDAKEQE